MAGGSSFKSFKCPNCQALYQIVKVEAGPDSVIQEVPCRVCGAPLAVEKASSCSNTSCCERQLAFKNRGEDEKLGR
jgi:predicted Zn finger-like uncharacterized protein